MPTTRPRYQVTETPDVGRALDVAARRWPHEPRSKLLVRLVRLGAGALEREGDDRVSRRREAVRATAQKYDDVFEAGYLSKLRQDWPE